MPVINVVIESSFTGPVGGFLQLVIDDKSLVNELIRQYCLAKGVPVNPSYTLINKSNLLLNGNKPLSYYAVKDRETLLLGTASNDSRSYRFGHWFTLAGLGFLFGLLGITICVILFAVIRTVPDNYAVVVDAGSTHSDVILYKWPGVKVNNTGEVVQVSTCYIKKGIAQVQDVSTYFKPCFTTATQQIPPDSQANAEVLLGATAGMRLLNSSDPQAAVATISNIKEYFKRSTELVVRESNIGIISGSIEGISGWITINFLKDTIYSEVGTLNASWGALDLGGASTQITFEVSESMKSHPLVTKLKLFGHNFHVFSQSFLCYGVVQAMLRYRALLLQEHLKSGNASPLISSPCDPGGRNVTVLKQDFQTPCLHSIKDLSLLMESVENYTFHGTGNYEECDAYIKRLLNPDACKSTGWVNCIEPASIPSVASERKFMGFASFAYAANALEINVSATKDAFLLKSKLLCSYSYTKVLEMKMEKEKENNYMFKDLENSCFKTIFVFSLLNDVYGINTNEKWKNIQFSTKVNDATLGWSLGYMINATDAIAAGKSVPTLQTIPFALLLVLFGIFLLLSIGFVFHGIKLRKSASYQRKIAKQMDEEIVKFISPEKPTQPYGILG